MGEEICVALYDFDTAGEGELVFKEGDTITITNKLDDEWWEGKCKGKSGLFPKTYVEVRAKPPPPNAGRPKPKEPPPREQQQQQQQSKKSHEDEMIEMITASQSTTTTTPAAKKVSSNAKNMNNRKSLAVEYYPGDEDKEGIISKYWTKFVYYYANESVKVRFIFIWVVGNAAYFFWTYKQYKSTPEYRILNDGITIARGCGAVLRLNCSLILIPVCRSLMLYLRETFLNRWILPVDKAVAFHKKIGWTIAFFSYIHTICHLFNVHHLSGRTGANLDQAGSGGAPVMINNPVPQNSSWTEIDWLFKSIPGFTGVLICIIMLFMFSTAYRPVRSVYFEAFWYTHHLFIFFYFLLLIHGTAGLFAPPAFWQWFIAPGVIYAYERYRRYKRGEQTTVVVDAIQHKSRVMELRFTKETFKYRVGQYLFLNVPYISEKEWHPFTISSCPDDPYVSVHIRRAGDWTAAAQDLFLKSEHRDEILNTSSLFGRPALRVDGPFGAAAEQCMTDYTIAVLVAAGIGVTPFSAILKEIRARYVLGGADFPLQKVYFIWTSRDAESFEWFGDLLSDYERGDLRDLLSINVYLTGGLKSDDIRNIVFNDPSSADSITGLQSSTQFGRPNFHAIMEELSKIHEGQNIGVFLCGPRALADTIRKETRAFTIPGSTKFTFHKENF